MRFFYRNQLLKVQKKLILIIRAYSNNHAD
jgi:hypothetical protein